VDDGGERIEEGERLRPRRAADRLRQARRGQRPGGEDRRPFRQRVDPLAHERDVGMIGERRGDAGGIAVAVDRQRRPGGNAMRVRLAHDQRPHRAHLLMEQADRIGLRIVRAEAVRADEFGEMVGLMRGGALARAAHLRQADAITRLGELPGGFRTGEAAADDMDIMGHMGALGRTGAAGNAAVGSCVRPA
jgi:hypothetical protein